MPLYHFGAKGLPPHHLRDPLGRVQILQLKSDVIVC